MFDWILDSEQVLIMEYETLGNEGHHDQLPHGSGESGTKGEERSIFHNCKSNICLLTSHNV